MDEMFDVYYADGRWRGRFPRSQCHGDPSLIHRSVHVAVFDRSGENILLQKRSMNKDIQPGKWDSAVGGHVDAGESVENAAVRELSEELGIDGQPEFFYETTIRNDIESENVTVFRLTSEGPFDFSADEIDEIRFWPLKDLTAEKIALRDDFTPNLKVELAQILHLLNA